MNLYRSLIHPFNSAKKRILNDVGDEPFVDAKKRDSNRNSVGLCGTKVFEEEDVSYHESIAFLDRQRGLFEPDDQHIVAVQHLG